MLDEDATASCQMSEPEEDIDDSKHLRSPVAELKRTASGNFRYDYSAVKKSGLRQVRPGPKPCPT